MDGVTFSDLFAIGRDEALARNSNLTLAVIDTEGTGSNALIAAAAAIGDEDIGQLSRAEAKCFLDSSEGKDLDRLVFDRYGIARKSAAPGVGSVEFRTTTANPSPFALPVNTLLTTADGNQYVTLASATFPLGSVGPVTVAARSILAGLSQQAASNTITGIVSQITGSPGDLTVNNPLATAGAQDDELDESLRQRAREFFPNARRGTLTAIRLGALAVSGVTTATVFEVLDLLGRPAKGVQLVVADTFTDQLVTFGTTPAYQTQSQVLTSAIAAALEDVRAAGIEVQITVAQVVLQSVTLALTFEAGVDYERVALAARARVVAFINALSPGQALSRLALTNALRTVLGLIITGNEVYAPSGDVVPEPLQVIRTMLALTVPIGLQPVGALQSSLNPDTV